MLGLAEGRPLSSQKTIGKSDRLLESSPELVNEDPLGKGWFFRFRPANASAVADLLDQAAYERLLNANADA
jgi:glycine cleavage system H lipoate-binding protein